MRVPYLAASFCRGQAKAGRILSEDSSFSGHFSLVPLMSVLLIRAWVGFYKYDTVS